VNAPCRRLVRAALAALVALVGCTERADPAPRAREGGAISVVDDTGRRVALARPARRIASLSPSNTEVLFVLGCGSAVVLRDRVSAFPAEARKIPATNPFELSPEHVAGFSPDLVLLSHADPGKVEALRQIGLAVAVFAPRTLEALYGDIGAIGALCGSPRRASELVASMRRRVDRVARSVAGRTRPRVYIETDGADPLKPWTVGPGCFVDHLLRIAGGDNIVRRSTQPYLQINVEEVFASDPDIVLLMGGEGMRPGVGISRLRARPGWQTLRAVREGRIVDRIHPDLLSRPGPRLVEGLELLAGALHGGAPVTAPPTARGG
jgi:iron complex transport system substrate-binding protein